MNQTRENGEKPNFGPDFGPFSPNLISQFFFVIFTSTKCQRLSQATSYLISRETYDPHSRKHRFGPYLGPLGSNSGRHFFSKIWLGQLLDIMVSYHHAQYQKKLMNQSSENLVTDGQANKQTDRRTDESDFIGRCPTNIERPTSEICTLF